MRFAGRRRRPQWTVIRVFAVSACLSGLGMLPWPSQAVAQASTAQSLRLYAFDCGRLTRADPQPLLTRGVTVTDMSVTAYLIVHPRGTVLWDSCVIPDELFNAAGATEGRATATRTLKSQLAEIGYKPADITYLVLSHNHFDHSANANSFAGSTWLVQRAEHDWMFPAAPRAEPLAGAERYSALRASRTVLLDGDHDVFGDGSVVILSTPGHTPGHQSLLVRLPKTGPVILSGDMVHFEENWINRRVPARNYNREQSLQSMDKVAAVLSKDSAKLWINHDKTQSDRIPRAPDFVE